MFRFVWSYLRKHRFALLFIVLCAVFTAVLDFTSPYLTAKFVDEVFLNNNLAAFHHFIVFLLITGILAIASNWYRSISSSKIRIKTVNKLVETMICHVQMMPGVFSLQNDMIYLSRRIDNDANDIVTFVINSISEICIHASILFISAYLLHSIGTKWLLFFIIIAIVHVVVYKAFEKTLFELSINVRETDSQYFSELSNNFLYLYSIKLHSLCEEYILRFRTTFEKYLASVMRAVKIDFWFKTNLLNANEILKVLVFLMGGIDVINNRISIGNFIALNSYYLLAMQGVSYFMNFGQGYQNVLAAYSRIIEIKNMPIDFNGTKIIDSINSISIEGVSFGWEKINVIENFTQLFVRGKIYCIIGKNGAGKSTLLNLICGMLHPVNGRIKYNDIPIEELDMSFIRKKLTAVTEQRNFLEEENLSGGEQRKKQFSKHIQNLLIY